MLQKRRAPHCGLLEPLHRTADLELCEMYTLQIQIESACANVSKTTLSMQMPPRDCLNSEAAELRTVIWFKCRDKHVALYSQEIVTTLIFSVQLCSESSGQKEPLCPPPFMSLWALPSSESAAGFSRHCHKVLGFFWQRRGVFPAFPIKTLRCLVVAQKVGGGCRESPATADLPCREVHAETNRNWPGAAPPHYIALHVLLPDSFKLAAFSWEGDVSADVLRSAVRMSISAAWNNTALLWAVPPAVGQVNTT